MPESRINKLIEDIHQGSDAGVKRKAIIALGYEQSPRIYPVLIDQLLDSNQSIQHAAVISLGRYGNPQAIEALSKPMILRSSFVDVRWAAVAAIGKLGDHKVIEQLVRAVDDDAWIVRNQAVTELKVKIRELTSQREAGKAHLLIRLLAMKDPEIIELAINGICELGSIVEPLLLEGLKNSSSRIREHSATALGRMKIKTVVPQLIINLKDRNAWVRRATARALGIIGDSRAIEPLVQSLGDHDESVQKSASRALVQFKILSTEPLLNTLAHEKSKFVLKTILYTLGEIGDPDCIPALIAQLKSSYFIIRNAAARALVKFGPPVIPSVAANLTVSESGVQSLLREAKGKNGILCQIRAIKALGALEDHRAVPLMKLLVEQAEDRAIADAADKTLAAIGEAAWGRCCALLVLREIGDPSAMPYFIQALADTSANVRLEAVRGLGRLNGDESIPHLIKSAGADKDPYVRAEALRFLRDVGVGYPDVLDLALASLKDKDRFVRMQAAGLLGNFHNDRSIIPLIQAMTDAHWGVRERAETSLHNFADRAVEPLIEALDSKSWTLRFRAVRLLGEIDDARSRPALEQVLQRKNEKIKVKTVARAALEKML